MGKVVHITSPSENHAESPSEETGFFNMPKCDLMGGLDVPPEVPYPVSLPRGEPW